MTILMAEITEPSGAVESEAVIVESWPLGVVFVLDDGTRILLLRSELEEALAVEARRAA